MKSVQVQMTKCVFIFLVLKGTLELMERALSMGNSFIAPGIRGIGVWEGNS
jgi:hypothetical protein